MKITKHQNGTLSFTGMTSNDVRNLKFAASTAGTFYHLKTMRAPSWNLYTTDNDGSDWNRRNAETFDRLHRALDIAANNAWAGTNDTPVEYLPNGASLTLVSDDFGPRTTSTPSSSPVPA